MRKPFVTAILNSTVELTCTLGLKEDAEATLDAADVEATETVEVAVLVAAGLETGKLAPNAASYINHKHPSYIKEHLPMVQSQLYQSSYLPFYIPLLVYLERLCDILTTTNIVSVGHQRDYEYYHCIRKRR